MEAAACAVWCMAAAAGPRAALVEAGAVEALAAAMADAVRWRKEWEKDVAAAAEAAAAAAAAALEPAPVVISDPLGLNAPEKVKAPKPIPGMPSRVPKGPPPRPASADLEACNRVVFACLGALGVLAVDAGARAHALKVGAAASSSSMSLEGRMSALRAPSAERCARGKDLHHWKVRNWHAATQPNACRCHPSCSTCLRLLPWSSPSQSHHHCPRKSRSRSRARRQQRAQQLREQRERRQHLPRLARPTPMHQQQQQPLRKQRQQQEKGQQLLGRPSQRARQVQRELRVGKEERCRRSSNKRMWRCLL